MPKKEYLEERDPEIAFQLEWAVIAFLNEAARSQRT
jgi:hypothetical protein